MVNSHSLFSCNRKNKAEVLGGSFIVPFIELDSSSDWTSVNLDTDNGDIRGSIRRAQNLLGSLPGSCQCVILEGHVLPQEL